MSDLFFKRYLDKSHQSLEKRFMLTTQFQQYQGREYNYKYDHCS